VQQPRAALCRDGADRQPAKASPLTADRWCAAGSGAASRLAGATSLDRAPCRCDRGNTGQGLLALNNEPKGKQENRDMRKLLLSTFIAGAIAATMPAIWTTAGADDAKPLAGKSITVLLPSPQGANIAAEFEKATGIHVDLQTLSWDDIRPKLVTALIA